MSEKKNEFDILELANQTSKFIETNFKAFMAVFIVALVAGSGWAVKKSMDRATEMEAFDSLYAITKDYQKKKADFQKAKDDKAQKEDPKNKDKKTEDAHLSLSTGDMTKDYGPEVEKLTAFLNSNPSRNASGEAALILSEIYEEYKMAEKGAEVLANTLKNWSEKNVIYFVMQMRAGDLWASSGNCEKATANWQVIANSDSFVKNQAQLKLGVCLQELGRLSEAKTWFETIEKDAPNSAEGFSAKRYLRFIEFKSKNDLDSGNNKAQQSSSKKDNKS